MRFILLTAVMTFSVSGFANDTLKTKSCAVRVRYIDNSVKEKLLESQYDLTGTGKIEAKLVYDGDQYQCPKLPKNEYSNGLAVISTIISSENIRIASTTAGAIWDIVSKKEVIKVDSLAKLCIYEVAADGSSKLVVSKHKEFGSNLFRNDSEVKAAGRKWLVKQIPECQEI